jgi:hypothetical protein
MTAPTVRRPGLVTLVVVLTVIGGIVSIGVGIIAMVIFGSFFSPGLIPIVLGLIYLAVAKGLADGNDLSRIVVAIVSGLQIVFAIINLFTVDDNGARNSPIGSAVVSLIILAILYSPKANAFFGSRSS